MKKKFTKLTAALALLALFILPLTGWGQTYTTVMECDMTTKAISVSAYNESHAYDDNWTIVNGANNQKNWAYFKMGGKSATISSYNPCYIYSTTAASSSVDKITVHLPAGSLSKNGMSVNSWGVYVYSNSAMTTQIDYVAGGTITNSEGSFDFTPSTGVTWASGYYYKVSWDLANTTTTNGIVCVDKITLYKEAGGPIQLTAPTLTATADNGKVTLEWAAVSNASSYTIQYADNSSFTGATTVTNATSPKEITGLTNGTTYYFKAMSVGDGSNYTSSDYGTAVSATPANITKITITQDNLTGFTNSYNWYDWTAGGVSGKAYAYKNSGMQFNSGKDAYWIYNSSAIPGTITSVKITKASGTDRDWYLRAGTSALTAITEGTQIGQAQTVGTTGATWEVTGTYNYFLLYVTGGSTVINSIEITYVPSTDPIIVASDPEALAYNATGGEFGYSITNPTSATLGAVSNSDWITNVSVDGTNSKVTFSTSTNTGAQRQGTITLSYTGATDRVITITQNAAPTPTITANDVEVANTATSGSIYATVNNYIAGSMAASTEASWITNFTYDQADEIFEVGFTVSQNTASTPRSATVTLTFTYNTNQTATKNVTVTQAATPISTIAGVWTFANSVGATSTATTVAFTDWYVTAVKGGQLFVTDGINGLVMYESDHGFSVGDKLNGTVQCNVLLYQSHYAEITGVKADMLTVTANQEVPVLTTTIDALAATNYGMVVSLGTLAYNGTNFVDASNNAIKPYNNFTIDDYPTLTSGANYNVKGIFYIYYSGNSSSNQIAPRTAADFTIVPDTYSITIATGLENNLITDPENEAEVGEVVEIAVIPPTGKVLETLTVSKDNSAETIAVSPEVSGLVTDYTFTMPADDVTISATFVDQSSTITLLYSVNGVDEEVMLYTTTGYVLPTPSQIPTGFNFAGWTKYESLPTISLLTSYTPVDSDVLVAVFSREEGGVPGNFELVTAAPSNWSGNYLIAYNDETFADGRIGGTDGLGKQNSSVNPGANLSNDVVEGTWGNSYYVTLEEVSANSGTYLMKTQDGKYNYQSSNNNGLSSTENRSTAESYPLSVSLDNDYVEISISAGAVFHYNTSGYFRFYKDGGQKKVVAYKQTAGTPGTVHYYTRVFQNETASDNITITGPTIIPSGYSLNMGNKQLTSNNADNFIVEDGAQLISEKNVQAVTILKNIEAYTVTGSATETADGWYFIASPLKDDYTPSMPMIANDYDLYRLNGTTWENAENSAHSADFKLVNGQGYLYANNTATTLSFAGETKGYSTVNNANKVDVTAGFNLIGNPYTFNTYINGSFYVMNADRNGVDATAKGGTYAIKPCTGVIVEAAADGQVAFSNEAISNNAHNGNVNMTLSQQVATRGDASSVTLDNAIVSFNEGSQLSKFYFGQSNANIYIPQNGKDYAIVSAEAQGEMPVCFKASVNGSYTLSVDAENVEMGYLHLIDNLTGMDVDLLATPSYSFEAKTSDYASRFRLVFSANNIAESNSENFAFFSDGQLIVTGLTGNETLQLIDALGRILVSTNATERVATDGMTPGVYVVRLVNGSDVKTQKIVVK